MINSISLIVLTHFFQFNQLKILRQPGYLVKPAIFFLQWGVQLHYKIMKDYGLTCSTCWTTQKELRHQRAILHSMSRLLGEEKRGRPNQEEMLLWVSATLT